MSDVGLERYHEIYSPDYRDSYIIVKNTVFWTLWFTAICELFMAYCVYLSWHALSC